MTFSTFRKLAKAWLIVSVHRMFGMPEFTYGWGKVRLTLIKQGKIT